MGEPSGIWRVSLEILTSTRCSKRRCAGIRELGVAATCKLQVGAIPDQCFSVFQFCSIEGRACKLGRNQILNAMLFLVAPLPLTAAVIMRFFARPSCCAVCFVEKGKHGNRRACKLPLPNLLQRALETGCDTGLGCSPALNSCDWIFLMTALQFQFCQWLSRARQKFVLLSTCEGHGSALWHLPGWARGHGHGRALSHALGSARGQADIFPPFFQFKLPDFLSPSCLKNAGEMSLSSSCAISARTRA